MGSTGKTDLILKWNSLLVECDVKLLGKGKNGCITWVRSIGKTAATPIGVHPETLGIRWHPKRVPLGWEFFWS